MNPPDNSHVQQQPVLRLRDVDNGSVAGLLSAFGLTFREIGAHKTIPGSYWGDEEAGTEWKSGQYPLRTKKAIASRPTIPVST